MPPLPPLAEQVASGDFGLRFGDFAVHIANDNSGQGDFLYLTDALGGLTNAMFFTAVPDRPDCLTAGCPFRIRLGGRAYHVDDDGSDDGQPAYLCNNNPSYHSKCVDGSGDISFKRFVGATIGTWTDTLSPPTDGVNTPYCHAGGGGLLRLSEMASSDYYSGATYPFDGPRSQKTYYPVGIGRFLDYGSWQYGAWNSYVANDPSPSRMCPVGEHPTFEFVDNGDGTYDIKFDGWKKVRVDSDCVNPEVEFIGNYPSQEQIESYRESLLRVTEYYEMEVIQNNYVTSYHSIF